MQLSGGRVNLANHQSPFLEVLSNVNLTLIFAYRDVCNSAITFFLTGGNVVALYQASLSNDASW
jgi:hypothetical protein